MQVSIQHYFLFTPSKKKKKKKKKKSGLINQPLELD